MGESFPGAIQIGGPVPHHLADELARTITDAGALAELASAPDTLTTADDLLAAVDPTAKIIRLYDHEASYGAFSSLEDWLGEHGIAYDRQSDARYECDGAAVSFRPDLGLVEHTAKQDGAATIALDDLWPVRDQLVATLAEPTTERVKAALAALDKATGPDVPPLTPFVLVD